MPALFVPLQKLENLAPDTWYVNVLAVLPEYRGAGLGTKLLGLAEANGRKFAKRGMRPVRLVRLVPIGDIVGRLFDHPRRRARARSRQPRRHVGRPKDSKAGVLATTVEPRPVLGTSSDKGGRKSTEGAAPRLACGALP